MSAAKRNSLIGSRIRLLRRRLRPITKEFGLTLYVLRRSKLAIFGVFMVGLFIFLALFGRQLAPYDPTEVNIRSRFTAPCAAHPFGTDKMGRDVLSRMMAGAQYSVRAGIVVLAISLPVGVILGGIAGMYGGWVDETIMRLTDVFLAFPSLILAMAFSAALGPSLFNAMLALSVVWWPYYTRLIRGQALAVRETNYVEAARSRGASNWHIMCGTFFRTASHRYWSR